MLTLALGLSIGGLVGELILKQRLPVDVQLILFLKVVILWKLMVEREAV